MFESLIVKPDRSLEWTDQVTDHVFCRVVQKPGAKLLRSEARFDRGENIGDDQAVLRDGKRVLADRLPVPARDPRQPVGDVFDLDVFGLRREKIETATRQHALPSSRSVVVLHAPRPAILSFF